MATKTITLELDAYEKLRAAKSSSRESFSEVVRRAVWPREPGRARDLLADFDARAGAAALSEEELSRLDARQSQPHRAPSRWDETARGPREV